MMRWLALAAAALWTWAGCSENSAPADEPSAPTLAPAPGASEVTAAPQAPPSDDGLAAYLLDSELAVAPLARQERAGESEPDARARYAEIAAAVAKVVRRDGPEAFPVEAPDVAAAHLGVVLVAIAAHETGFLRALDGDSMPCPMHLGGCDGGWAHSLWQVHARAGRDRAYYLSLASGIAARSLRESGGLCWYTGSCGSSTATRDIEAIYRARWAAHPFTPDGVR